MLAFKRGERRLLRGGEADAERRAKPKAAKRTCAAGSMTERREGHRIRQPTAAPFSKEKAKRREQAHRPTGMCGDGEARGREADLRRREYEKVMNSLRECDEFATQTR